MSYTNTAEAQDLFTGSDEPSTQPQTATTETASLPLSIRRLDETFDPIIDLLKHVAQEKEKVDGVLKSVGADTYASMALKFSLGDALESEIGNLVTMMLRMAGQELGTTRAPFNREHGSDLLHALKKSAARHFQAEGSVSNVGEIWACCRPWVMWQKLCAAYSPEQEERRAGTLAAEALFQSLGLRRRRDVKWVRGKVKLTYDVYVQTWHDGRRILMSDRFDAFIGAWKVFAEHAGLDSAATDALAQELLSYHWGHREVESRHRAVFGNGVELITYFNKFEFLLPEPIAEALNVFMAEYRRQS